MNDDLKPCPFCGGRAEHSIGKTGDGKPWHYVECVDCGATGPTPSYADHNIAVIECRAEAWNTRADRIEELEAQNELLQQMIASLPPPHPDNTLRNRLVQRRATLAELKERIEDD